MTETEIERLFLMKVYEYMHEPGRENEIHLTDLTGECVRKIWFAKKTENIVNIETLWRTFQGKILHELPLLEQHELELEYDGVKTKIDEYQNGILVEKKFVNFIPENYEQLKKYYSNYILQVQLEALFLVMNGYDVKDAYLLFVKRGDDFVIKVFRIEINLDEAQKMFYERKRLVEKTITEEQPPELPPNFSFNSYPCSYCDFRERCWLYV